jgi:hypothetical protein
MISSVALVRFDIADGIFYAAPPAWRLRFAALSSMSFTSA